MNDRHKEVAFEAAIEDHLVSRGGYGRANTAAFDRKRAQDPQILLTFIHETQPDKTAYLQNILKEKTDETLLAELGKALDSDNEANLLTVTRQLRYSDKHHNTLDLVLSLNGLPLVSAELKNPLTGQTWRDAVRQYETDRDQKVFDSVVVVTDRLVLDQQLQNTVYQFDHKQGVVQKIDRDSGQLAGALAEAEEEIPDYQEQILRTMYVDKRLLGIHAVQTLSRLNRTHPPLKTDTFILDFVNESADIQAAFQPYYESTMVGEEVEPRHLYELQARLNACIDPAVNRFKQLEKAASEEFRKVLIAYRNLYAFLSQIIPFHDSDLETLYAFVRFLLYKLPKRGQGPEYRFDEEVALKYYRLEKIHLSKLIDILNERFGTTFKPADQFFFDSFKEDAAADEKLRQVANANTFENFFYVFKKTFLDFIIGRMEQNEDTTSKLINEEPLRAVACNHIARDVYDRIRAETSSLLVSDET